MFTTTRIVLRTVLFALLAFFTPILSTNSNEKPREYGLKQEDREFEIARKLGAANASQVRSMLQEVRA